MRIQDDTGRAVEWDPKTDITTYELAHLTPVLILMAKIKANVNLKAEAADIINHIWSGNPILFRHFKKINTL